MDTKPANPADQDSSRKTRGTTDLSIRVLRDKAGRPQWNIGGRDSPTRIMLEAVGPAWAGYCFDLGYLGSSLASINVMRCDDRPEVPALSARLLQRVPLGQLDRFAQQWMREFFELWNDANPPTAAHAIFPDPLDWLDLRSDPDAGSVQDVKLARLAQRYLETLDKPTWRRILANEFGYSESSVQTMIARARKRRLLTPVTRGQSGGQLTPKARRLLAPAKAPSAWDRATPEQQQARIDAEALIAKVHAEIFADYRDGNIDAATYHARFLTMGSLVEGNDPETAWPDEPTPAIREAVRHLQHTYEELR